VGAQGGGGEAGWGGGGGRRRGERESDVGELVGEVGDAASHETFDAADGGGGEAGGLFFGLVTDDGGEVFAEAHDAGEHGAGEIVQEDSGPAFIGDSDEAVGGAKVYADDGGGGGALGHLVL